MKTFSIEHTHSITDLYYIEAESEEEAEKIFRSGNFDGEPEETWEVEDAEDEIEIEEVNVKIIKEV